MRWLSASISALSQRMRQYFEYRSVGCVLQAGQLPQAVERGKPIWEYLKWRLLRSTAEISDR